jgi:hypothetical protein
MPRVLDRHFRGCHHHLEALARYPPTEYSPLSALRHRPCTPCDKNEISD